ncbi:hypothetical protein DAEQUDRAFT_731724 [Daedalea quercina L-15889]|uniref:Uncharacterized protein n=1 Tax=Daedalea quercina L-15889 TaxID=1314783 RepID=A0A165M3Z9_9APHY|nr:hypothetical protein DAEQUDRAFT_731724 [Daedalea quercina L-15889]
MARWSTFGSRIGFAATSTDAKRRVSTYNREYSYSSLQGRQQPWSVTSGSTPSPRHPGIPKNEAGTNCS